MHRTLAALLASATLLTACSTSGGNEQAKEPTTTVASSTSDKGTTTTAKPAPDARTIDWEDCGGGFQCGTITVPLDYSKPDGKTIDVAVTRHPAEDPENRIGTLFMNPGGPGGSAIELARSYSRAGDIGDRFDIVGFDPRGVGESSPLDCHSHLVDIYDTDPSIDSEADRTAMLETSQAFVDEFAEDGDTTTLLPAKSARSGRTPMRAGSAAGCRRPPWGGSGARPEGGRPARPGPPWAPRRGRPGRPPGWTGGRP